MDETVVEAFPQAARLNKRIHTGERGFPTRSFLLCRAILHPNLTRYWPHRKSAFAPRGVLQRVPNMGILDSDHRPIRYSVVHATEGEIMNGRQTWVIGATILL